MKSALRREAVGAAEPPAVHAVVVAQRREVDQVDQGDDHHRRQGRHGQALEIAREKEQGENRQAGDDQADELGSPAGGAVHRRLREAAVDGEPTGDPSAEVRGAEADQLTIRVDLSVLPAGQRSWRSPGSPQSRRASPPRLQPSEPPKRSRLTSGSIERRQARIDRADDRHPVGAEVEELDDADSQDHGHQRPRDRAAPPEEPRTGPRATRSRPAA